MLGRSENNFLVLAAETYNVFLLQYSEENITK